MLVLVIVRSRLADSTGHTVLAVLPNEPSMVTLSAPLSVINPAAAVPERVRGAPVGLIKMVWGDVNSLSKFVPSSIVISPAI